ncbi:MAG: twin-arginine translocase subunit TatC [Acidobacteriota bacterium]
MPQDEQENESVPALNQPGGLEQPLVALPPAPEAEEEDEDEEGMLRMSFLDHLEELRSRIIKAVVGLVVTYAGCLLFAGKLWEIVSEPAASALRTIGAEPDLAQLEPMDGFLIVYFKLPLLAALFIASPWILWQVWAFVAPGLYKKERKLAGLFDHFAGDIDGIDFTEEIS